MPGTETRVTELRRIHFRHRRREQKVRALGRQHGRVGLFRAGVDRQVLVGAELGGVDEQGHAGAGGEGPGPAHKGQVALVQGAHGGNQADALAGAAPPADASAQVGDRANDVQVAIGGHRYEGLKRLFWSSRI